MPSGRGGSKLPLAVAERGGGNANTDFPWSMNYTWFSLAAYAARSAAKRVPTKTVGTRNFPQEIFLYIINPNDCFIRMINQRVRNL